MKKYMLFYVIAPLMLISCGEENRGSGSVSVGPISEVSAEPFVGSVILNWTVPMSESYYYTLISYDNSAGERINKKVSRFSASESGKHSIILGGLLEVQEYSFTLKAVANNGDQSAPVTVSSTSQSIESAKDYVIGTVKVEPAKSGLFLIWENESGVPVELHVSYKEGDFEATELVQDATLTGRKKIDVMKETAVTVTAKNTSGGEDSKELEFTITPELDPDDVVNPDIEYITFEREWMCNNTNMIKDEKYYPYQYTLKTVGPSPYRNMDPLENPVAGPVLVFRYKTNVEFDLELFWCDAGAWATGGRQTMVRVPKNQSGDWETFRHDYSEAMVTHNWQGNIGDYARFDVKGVDGALVELNLRNVHFEAAE